MSKHKVFVTRPIFKAAMEILRTKADAKVWQSEDPPSKEVIRKEVENIDGLISLLTDPIDAEIINAGEHLKVISQIAVG